MHPAAKLLHREHAALLLVDMQERLLPHIEDHQAVLANCIRLVRFARILNLPVLLCEQQKLGPTVGPLQALLQDVPAIEKLHFSCLRAPSFAEKFQELQCQALVLAGVETHVCILQTALDALQHMQVHVVSNATGSRAPLNRDMALARLRQAGAVTSTVEMLIFELLEQAGTDEFREALPLVKD